MKKIKNPWTGEPTYHCYGCSPDSASGLRMEFYEDGDEIVSHWHPRPEFQGWRDTLHGGIQATLADEIASWVKYHKPIMITDSHITLRASVKRQLRNIIEIGVSIFDHTGELCTSAICVYFLFPQKRAYEEFGFREFVLEEEA